MEEIPLSIKNNLIKSFKSEKKILNAIENYELYLFSEFSTNQIFKIFNKNEQDIFSETNSKKHFQKISEMIKNNFLNEKTQNYFNFFLSPTKNLEEYKKRKEIFENIKFEFTDNSIDRFKKIIKSLSHINYKTNLKYKLITLDIQTEKYLIENFKVSAHHITKKELEEMIQNENVEDTIIITEEKLFIEIPTYDLKSFKKILIGNIIKNNLSQIENLIDLLNIVDTKSIINKIEKIANMELSINVDSNLIKENIKQNEKEKLKEIANRTLRLEEETQNINKELKEIISKKQLSLQGEELLELLNTNDLASLQKKLKSDLQEIISEKEKEIINYYKQKSIKVNSIFSNSTYPLQIDNETIDDILKQIEMKNTQSELEEFERLGEISLKNLKNLLNFAYFTDLFYGVWKFSNKYYLNYPIISNEILILEGKNIYLQNPIPVNYGLGTKELNLKEEKITVLTGANSGGKTTLLEMILQSSILSSIGLGICASKSSKYTFVEEIIYLKKFSGTQGSGAFEQTVRNLIEILDSDKTKIILIDEFEAITEPGAAAKILVNFLKEISKTNSFCISVSHLGIEIKEFLEGEKITNIRLDGISAEGLDEKGNLITNHQPKFYCLGKSTPELIIKRILKDNKFWEKKSQNSKELLKKIIESN